MLHKEQKIIPSLLVDVHLYVEMCCVSAANAVMETTGVNAVLDPLYTNEYISYQKDQPFLFSSIQTDDLKFDNDKLVKVAV